MAQWDFAGWTLPGLLQLQDAWQQITPQTVEEHREHQENLAAVAEAIRQAADA